MAKDTLDPEAVLAELGPVDDVLESVAPGDAHVCDFVGDDGVCAETFPTPLKLGLHKKQAHGIAGKWANKKRPAKQTKAASDSSGRAKRKPPEQATATRAAGPATDRAATYTASLSMAALAAYFALPPFDQTDLDICNAGTPNIGRALAQVADHNASVARACDLILGGGAGGDYIAVIMAVVPVVGAIAAHHGVIPATSGSRFGEMIGVAPTPTKRDDDVVIPTIVPNADTDRTADDVIAFFAGTPETVMTDAMTKMMSMGGAVEVAVPFDGTTPMTWAQREAAAGDGERGSEQLRPTVPTAEPEPVEAVPA